MSELGRIYWSRQLLKLGYSAAVLWLGWSIITPLLRGPAAPAQVAAGPSGAADVLMSIFQPVLDAAIAPAAVLLALGLTAAVITSRDARRRDPVRRFTRQQRREGMARADGRCEFGVGARRCSRPAEHGDHFYPWSKGGSTTLQNFVAACSRCNRSKGARIPSPSVQRRIERRRVADGLDAADILVGERGRL
ncbi:HNH endonuclease [Arthrobacter sp. JZ12]|uniref:HNH endonuclease n=1 Tax=Arthrobacter sp. JZ12 TaxID=2654190 RepID=UPI002B458E4F|nr:HNH endonuclease signature motif containing protein [Arthrobacter sp. JZ12]WRH24223.1 HNH endonuclease [Arthrobacter sp. JZ12]